MPLAFAAYLALCAGLVLGAISAPLAIVALATVALATAALAAAVRRDLALGALALTLGAGALAARAHGAATQRCAARARRGELGEVVLFARAAPGDRVVGRSACGLALTLVVARGRGEAGARVSVRGTVMPSARGALVRDATLIGAGRPNPLLALRARTGETIDDLFAEDAPLARALVIADQASIAPAVRDRFADAGLIHALSVSGLHVSIVAAALELLLGALRLPRRGAAIGAALAVSAYVALIGAPAPAVRAGAMLSADVASRSLQRPTSPWAILALGGTLPLLLDPGAVLDAGYQLSMAGMAALVAGRALARRELPATLARWQRVLYTEMIVGAAATIVTAPIVAWWFARLSIVGPLANLVASPIIALLQPTLFLGVCLAPAAPIARHVAGAARTLLHALDYVAATAAALSHASIAIAPDAITLAWSAVAVVAVLVACAARREAVRSRAIVVAAAHAAGAVLLPVLPRAGGGALEMHMLDVGQGDAVALRTPRGRWILVDAGRTWRGGDAGRASILPYLRRRGGSLALFVLSHPHADHVGGAETLLRAMRPAMYWDAGFALGSGVYRASLVAAREVGVPWRRVRPGDSLEVDGVILRVLAPDSAWTAGLRDPNLASVVLSASYGQVRFLLVGDAEAPEERWLLDRAARDTRVADALRADVLKVAHHGSRTSSAPEFIAAVRPRVALVSVGEGNSYRLPNAEVLDRIASAGAQVVRTDQWGPIVVRTNGRDITVSAGEASWRVGGGSASESGSAPRRRGSRGP